MKLFEKSFEGLIRVTSWALAFTLIALVMIDIIIAYIILIPVALIVALFDILF